MNIKIEDITEECVNDYCICYECKKIVPTYDIECHNNQNPLSGFGLSDSTILQKCKKCSNIEFEKSQKKHRKARLLLMKQYLGNRICKRSIPGNEEYFCDEWCKEYHFGNI